MDAPPNDSAAPPTGDVRAPTPAPPLPPPPSSPHKNGLLFFAIVLALYGVLGTLSQIASPLFGLAWSEGFALLLPAVVAAGGSNLYPSRALLLSRRPGAPALALAPLLGAVGFLGAGALMELTSLLLPSRWLEIWDVSKLFERPPLERAALSVAAATVAPFCEEAAFRGWLLTALRTRYPTGAALVLSGVLFAAMHLDPVRFSALVALGALYAWMTWRSGSIWPAVIAHAVNNGLGILLATTGAAETPLRAARLRAPQVAGAATITLALAGGVLFLLAQAYRRAAPSPPPLEDALVRRDPGDPSTEFRFRRVPVGQVAAIAAALASLAGLLALALARRR